MKRKLLTIFICCLVALTLAFSLVSCGDNNDNKETQNTESTESGTENTDNTESTEGGESDKKSECELNGHTFANATCTSPKTCSVCGATDGEALGHTPNEDDGDCTTAILCKVCTEVTSAGKASHDSEADDGDCTTAITCSECGTVTTEARNEHTGGTATCGAKAVCESCGTAYGEIDLDNHDLTTVDNNGVCECGQPLTFVITNSGVNANYDNLEDALAAWTDNTTLTLFSDVLGLTEYIKTFAKGLVLDLNGHKIECSHTLCTIWIEGDSSSELTIRDGKGGGYIQGSVYAVSSRKGLSTLRLESGTVETVSANGDFTMTGGCIAGDDFFGLGINSEVEVIIDGGEIYGGRYGILNYCGNLTVSGTAKITATSGCAIDSNVDGSVVVSGTPTISGGTCEFTLGAKITLNTQPAYCEVWRVKIDSYIEDGIFAIPGEGVTLDMSKFASAMNGYEVKQNAKGELLLCNHTEQFALTNGDGTHNITCWCNETTFERNLACSGGVATDTHKAYCSYCNAPYGELNPNVHFDIVAANMTAEELEVALLELLNSGKTDISIILTSNADIEMFEAINNALISSTAAESSINLTIAGVQVIPNGALGNGYPELEHNTDPTAVKTLNLPDAVTLEMNALSLPTVQAVYLPKVTEWEIWGIGNDDNMTTLVLTAPGPITADFTDLSTGYIDLILHENKRFEVTNSNQWNGEKWKSISFGCFDGTTNHDYQYSDNGDGTHDEVCSKCAYVKVDNETHTFDAESYDCICGAIETVDVNLADLTATYVIKDSKCYHFTGSGCYGIKVESGNPRIVLNNANITVGEGSAIDVASGSTTTIFVMGDNTIDTDSMWETAGGIFVAEGGTVNITSNGTDNILRAHGTLAAAIGGKYVYDNNESYNAGNISISNVTVYTYTNDYHAAAIGAAGNGTCGTINITNAVVYAYGAGDNWTSAPGIGSAWGLVGWAETIPVVIISDSEIHTFRYNYGSDYIGYLGDIEIPMNATGSINCGEGGSVKSSTIYCYTGLDATTTDKVVTYDADGTATEN